MFHSFHFLCCFFLLICPLSFSAAWILKQQPRTADQDAIRKVLQVHNREASTLLGYTPSYCSTVEGWVERRSQQRLSSFPGEEEGEEEEEAEEEVESSLEEVEEGVPEGEDRSEEEALFREGLRGTNLQTWLRVVREFPSQT